MNFTIKRFGTDLPLLVGVDALPEDKTVELFIDSDLIILQRQMPHFCAAITS